MHSSKRRKISTLTDNPRLSAFAARQILMTKRTVQIPELGELNSKINRLLKNKPHPTKSMPPQNIMSLMSKAMNNNHPYSSQADSELIVSRPNTVFSTLVPDCSNFKEFQDGSKFLSLSPGERLVVIGQYEISVLKGEITLLCATLRPTKKYRVFAPQTHSLPVIRCVGSGVNRAEIKLCSIEDGLEVLDSLSPLFGNIWSNCSETKVRDDLTLPHDICKFKVDKFRILFSSSDNQYRASIQPLISPPEWNSAISDCTGSSEKSRIIFICGPKGTGKSTFVKLLLNKLLLGSAGPASSDGVMLMDLDPGQPEYSPPGQLSLIHIKEPNFGPPYSHPVPGCINKNLRTHSIGSISPNIDPSLYKACALDLFSEYCRLLSCNLDYPLIINTPGWVLGTGLEILVYLIEHIRPTDTIYMSLDGPSEVVDTLRETDVSKNFVTLPSQTSGHSIRTSAQLRQMQCMSYFHLSSVNTDTLSWNPNPLTSVRPWEIRYSGQSPGIMGVICYGESPPTDLLAEALNGSLVSIIVLNDLTAIPSWSPELGSKFKENDNQDESDHVKSPKFLQSPIIIKSPEDIPYFNPINSISLHPEKSRSLGLALVRGIDVCRRRIQVITPISHSIFDELQESRRPVVLVYGKLDCPGWAYTEQLLHVKTLEKMNETTHESINIDKCSTKNNGDLNNFKGYKISANMFHKVPWVERLEGHQGRSAGSFVWRVRRDLGKISDRWD